MNWAQERGRTSVEYLWTQRKVQARVSRKISGPWSNRCGKACQKNHCHYMTAMTGMVNLFISPTWWILWVHVFFKSIWSTFWICLILFDPFWSFLRWTVNCGSSTIGKRDGHPQSDRRFHGTWRRSSLTRMATQNDWERSSQGSVASDAAYNEEPLPQGFSTGWNHRRFDESLGQPHLSGKS